MENIDTTIFTFFAFVLIWVAILLIRSLGEAEYISPEPILVWLIIVIFGIGYLSWKLPEVLSEVKKQRKGVLNEHIKRKS